ncbi:MAG: hypothetical protein J6S26_00915 [Solobacterium sp.]|nr:hypothetical protein [Solobacterium sp.]
MFNTSDISRDACQLIKRQAEQGYDWWWHSFTGVDETTGEEKAFFIEFFLCNPALGEEAPVFGQLPENRSRGKKPSYLMVKAGSWGKDAAQLHRFFGIREVKVDMGVPFSVEAGAFRLSETHTEGSVSISEAEAKQHPEWMCGWGSMSWNLSIRKEVAFNVGYGAGKLFRFLQLFEMFWHAEGMKTAYEGEVVWNGKTYRITPETCYGYADKNWGKDFTSPWVWLSSNDLVSRISGKKLNSSVFDIGGGCPKVGPLSLPRKLLSAFWYEGTPYEFNFSKFWTFTRTSFSAEETEDEILWHVEQKTWRSRMVTDIRCRKEEMLWVNYEAPDGVKRHNRLWNGGTGTGTVKLYRDAKLIEEADCFHVGCEYGEYD